jgi:hypothetical protein
LVALTSSSSPEPNWRAWAAIAVGLLAAAAIPAAIVVTERQQSLQLIDAAAAIPIAIVAALAAIVLGTRARRHSEFTLGRVGGAGAGTVGRWLGIVGLYVGITAALAVAFYGLLTLFE